MSATAKHPKLRAEVQKLAEGIGLDDGELAIAPKALADSRAHFAVLSAKARIEVATELVALGLGIERQGGARAGLALAQIVLLVAELLGSSSRAAELFARVESRRSDKPEKAAPHLRSGKAAGDLWK